MATVHVSLFGKFHAGYGSQILAGLDIRKVQELFCYLLLYRQRPHPRETLAGLLWGESHTAQSKKYLRQALWHLQTALESGYGHTACPLLLVEPEWIQINYAADLWLDVAVFEGTFEQIQRVPEAQLDAQHAQALQAAVQLYQDDLLVGCYQDWCLYERERLQHMYLSMLDKLMRYSEMRADYDSGLLYGERILRQDRAHERTHRRLMRILYLQGDRTAALRQYDRCVTALDEELGVKPTARTRALYDQIRADQVSQFSSQVAIPVLRPTLSEPNQALLPQVLGRLKQLQSILNSIQLQVQQDIQAVEQTLGVKR